MLDKIISVVMVLGGAALLPAALVLTAAIQLTDYMLSPLIPFNFEAKWLFSAFGSFVLDTITFALLFKFLPPVPIRLRHVWFAALICTFVWVAADEFLALFGMLFGYDRSVYGAMGGVLVAMVWMNIVSQAFFFGAEVCKVSSKERYSVVDDASITAAGRNRRAKR
jgi:membrane protein